METGSDVVLIIKLLSFWDRNEILKEFSKVFDFVQLFERNTSISLFRNSRDIFFSSKLIARKILGWESKTWEGENFFRSGKRAKHRDYDRRRCEANEIRKRVRLIDRNCSNGRAGARRKTERHPNGGKRGDRLFLSRSTYHRCRNFGDQVTPRTRNGLDLAISRHFVWSRAEFWAGRTLVCKFADTLINTETGSPDPANRRSCINFARHPDNST